MDNSYIEIKIKVSVDNLERVENVFYKLGRYELSIEDPRHLYEENTLNLDTYFNEEEILVDGKDICTVKYYLSDKENVIEFIEIIKSSIDSEKIPCTFETNKVMEEDWANNWKKYYHTFKINDKIVVKPEWEDYTPQGDEIMINIDPGMAFGTGTHETTKLCIQMIDKYMKKDYSVYDVGTGSGILAILASKLGAKEVVAIDVDKVSISASKYNIDLNSIKNIDVLHGNLLEKMTFKGDLIVANIIAEIIYDLIPSVKEALSPCGVFITSGIIESKSDLIKGRLKEFNMDIIDELRENGWCAFAVKLS